MGNGATFDFSEVSALDRRLLQFAERDYPKHTKQFLNKTIGNEGRRVMRQMIKQETEKRTGTLRRKVDKKLKKNSNGTYVVRIYSRTPYSAPVEFGHKVRRSDSRVEGAEYAHKTYEYMASVFPERVDAFLDEYLRGFET